MVLREEITKNPPVKTIRYDSGRNDRHAASIRYHDDDGDRNPKSGRQGIRPDTETP